MKILYLVPARGGSKGIPGKNIKPLCGTPLIWYTIDVIRKIARDSDICISTDDDLIIRTVNDRGMQVPFKRPSELASDFSGSYEVIMHALQYYMDKGIEYDAVMLLQPTSPFRKVEHIKEMISLFDFNEDMLVSVFLMSHFNPYFSLFEENRDGLLSISKSSEFTRRQDCPAVYAYNGSIYLMNVKSLRSKTMKDFTSIRKYVMDDVHSIDIDTELDWIFAESIIKNNLFKKL